MTPVRCVIYIRVSTEDQALGKSLESQQADCEAYAARQAWQVLRVFVEPGESAKTAERPVFQDMIAYCRRPHHRVDRILFWKISRYVRNTEDGFYFIRELRSVGCTVASATEPISDTPEGKVLLTNLLMMAEYENAVRAQHTKRIMRHLAGAGYWVHQPPLGYRRARDVGGFPILEPDEAIAPDLRHVFTEIAAGRMTTSGAVHYLRSLNRRGVRAAARLSPQTVHDLLRKEVYSGRIRSTLTDGVSVAAKFPGIVSPEIFEAAQRVLSGRAPLQVPRRRGREDFPLRGFVTCASCGLPLTASWSRGRNGRYAYYRCRQNCKGSAVSAARLESEFHELLGTVRRRSGQHLQLFREVFRRSWIAWTEISNREEQRRSKERARLETQRAALLDKLLCGVVDDLTYTARESELKDRIADLCQQRTGSAGAEIQLALDIAVRMLDDLPSTWQRAGLDGKQRFQLGVFRERIPWSAQSGFGTAATHHLFSMLQRLPITESGMAPPTGCSWNQDVLIEFTKRIESMRDLVAA